MFRAIQLLALGGVVLVLQGGADTQIAFDSDRHGGPDIYVIKARGGPANRITRHPGGAVAAAWSPLADRLAFVGATPSAESMGTWVVGVASAGGAVRHSTPGRAISWSPRGDEWAHSISKSNQTTWHEVHILDIASGRFRVLAPTMELGGGGRVAWSPSGESIAVHSYIVEADTGAFHKWIESVVPASLDWSQDGRRIVFQYGVGLNVDIYVANVDGTNVHKIVEHPAIDAYPSWSPDSAEIAFMSNRDGNREIYVVGVDTGLVRNLTRHPADDAHPDWAPDISLLSIFAKEVVTWGRLKGVRR